MTLRVSVSIISGAFEKAMEEMAKPIAVAATAAMDETAQNVKTDARNDIARAGFSRRWQNALRVERFPRRGKVSINAAVFVWHKIPYANVFEEGASVRGRPLLWLPLPTTPKRVGRNRMTPENFRRGVAPLVSLRSRSGNPLLGVEVRLSKRKAQEEQPKITLATMRKGRSGPGILRTIPVFVGIRSANIRKQLNIRKIVQQARDRLASVYASKFEGD